MPAGTTFVYATEMSTGDAVVSTGTGSVDGNASPRGCASTRCYGECGRVVHRAAVKVTLLMCAKHVRMWPATERENVVCPSFCVRKPQKIVLL